MRRIAVAGLMLLALIASALTSTPAQAAKRNARVTLCHKVGGPHYVQITVATQAALNGHAKNHEQDIIPPFPGFAGQNWDDDGQDIWQNGCVPAPSPEPIAVFVTCVEPAGDGTLRARFGYESDNAEERTIPIGDDNAISPDGPGRGQPTTFEPGRVPEAFTVTAVGSGTSVTWTVRFAGATSSATASESSPRCSTTPEPSPTTGVFVDCVQPQLDGTYSATFGYQNDEQTTINVAVGTDNAVTPGGPDRGQPAAFPPGRVEQAFTVAGIPRGQASTWTVRAGGYERSATATIRSRLCSEPPPTALPIGIQVLCVSDIANGVYSATFGYDNPNTTTIEIPVGDANGFSPAPADRGQPSEFAPGTTEAGFTVSGIPEDDELRWTISFEGTRTATASSDFPVRCPEGPTEPPVEPSPDAVGVFLACVDRSGDTYSATFGYENPGSTTVTIPTGARNGFSPAPTDRGQPTSFAPGNVEKAFTVSGIPAGDRITWRVTTGDGATASATADDSARDCVTNPPPVVDPELPIAKSADTAAAVVGQPIRYRLAVRNTGTGSALNVTVTDRLPRALRLRSVSGAGMSCVRARVVRCRTSRLLPGRRLDVRLSAVPTRTGEVVNGGSVEGGGSTDTDDATVTVTLPRARRLTG